MLILRTWSGRIDNDDLSAPLLSTIFGAFVLRIVINLTISFSFYRI